MALQFGKYEEEIGCSVDSGKRCTEDRISVTAFTKTLRKQNKKLKKACKPLPVERRTKDEVIMYYKKREEAVLKMLAKQMKHHRKMIKKAYENAENIAVAERDGSMVSETREENPRDFEGQSIDKKSLWKAIEKQMKKTEKTLKKTYNMRLEESRADQKMVEEDTKDNMAVQGGKSEVTDQHEKTFLHKLGDAFLKALPNLLCLGVKLLFGGVFKWGKNLRLGIA